MIYYNTHFETKREMTYREGLRERACTLINLAYKKNAWMKKKLKSKRDEKPVRIFLIQFPVLRLGGGVALGIASLLWQMVL